LILSPSNLLWAGRGSGDGARGLHHVVGYPLIHLSLL
jgi:hypothetical protein